MKRFALIFFMTLCFIINVYAQTNFNYVIEEETDEITENPPMNSAQESENGVTEQVTATEVTQDKVGENKEDETVKDTVQVSSEEEQIEDEEEEEAEEEKIFIALNDIQNTLAAVRSVSYCSATLVMLNNTKRNIQEISGTIGIGDQNKKFQFLDIKAKSAGGYPLQIVGKACESILALPNLQINKCQMERTSDSKCRRLLIYVPIQGAQKQ